MSFPTLWSHGQDARPTMQARCPHGCHPPAECPWETACTQHPRNVTLSCQHSAGQAKWNSDTCSFVLLAAISDRPIILCGLMILFNDRFYFLSYTVAYNNNITNYEQRTMVEKGITITMYRQTDERSISYFERLRSFALGHGIIGSLIRAGRFETAW